MDGILKFLLAILLFCQTSTIFEVRRRVSVSFCFLVYYVDKTLKMNSPSREMEEASSTSGPVGNGPSESGHEEAASGNLRPPAKRPISNAVIEISDTESDDSDICAITSYQASADEVKRIRGDDYSSTSSSDYSSDSDSEDDTVIIPDYKVSTKSTKAPLYPRASRNDEPKLNSKIKSQEFIDRLKSHWRDRQELSCEEATLTPDPFPVCLLHDFLTNSDFINNIVDDMNTLEWSRKKMDLYEFHQTTDLTSLTWQRSIKGIHELLKTEVMEWVSQVTGLQLRSVSASCSLYGPGDHLLVHDDLLADRRVAFILYLAPWEPALSSGAGDHVDLEGRECGWSAHMGGALELLARDARGPTRVARRVYPRNNMLAFFKVDTDSFHQVGEVLSFELPRLSINGWFHGPPDPAEGPPPAAAPAPAAPPASLPAMAMELGLEEELEEELGGVETQPAPPSNLEKPHNEVVVLTLWVEATYMAPRSRAALQDQMERHSEACLEDFLLPDRCRELLLALGQPDVEWEECGPANRRRYERVRAAWALAQPRDHPVRGLLQLFTSAAFCRLLADCTDLCLAGHEALELQRWRPACFTLIPPREEYLQPRLEAVYYLGAARALAGGGTTYLAPEDAGPSDAALVTLRPGRNTLNLVYCDSGAASFRKYLSRLSVQDDDCFYVLTCTYKE